MNSSEKCGSSTIRLSRERREMPTYVVRILKEIKYSSHSFGPISTKRRLKYYECAIDLLQNTPHEPETKPNPNGKNELVHRFAGMTKDGDLFYVQIKEDKRSDNKYFMSVFPPE